MQRSGGGKTKGKSRSNDMPEHSLLVTVKESRIAIDGAGS